MARFWNSASSAEVEAPAPPPPPPPAPEPDKIDRLTEAVATLAENQLRQAQPAPQQQYAPAQPAIPDISDEDMERIYEEGDRRAIRQAEDIKRNAATERLRRELGGELATFRQQGLGQLNRMTKQALLRDDPYYTKDKQYKQDIDALVNQVEGSGAMLTEEALQWIQHKVTGQHHNRLVKEEVEAEIRKAREGTQPTRPANRGGAGLPPDLAENYGLGPEQLQALQHLNRGRGRTPDEFAAELPPRKLSITATDGNRAVTRIETRRYTNFGDTLRDRQWSEKELERQHGIMTGQIDPRTPITPRQ